MKIHCLVACCYLLSITCRAQDSVSTKTFPTISMVNKIDFLDPAYNQPRFSCGFLLVYGSDTFAVTARHLLKIIKTPSMKTVALQPSIIQWAMYPLTQPTQIVVMDSLLTEDPKAKLEDKATYNEDWLLFTIKQNLGTVQPLRARSTPPTPGEKLYVVGWTRKMEDGMQRVYEFEYLKTVGNRLLLKDLIVPPTLGGLSGAPVVDEQGMVVGIVSNGTMDPDTDKKYFSPYGLGGLLEFIKRYQKK